MRGLPKRSAEALDFAPAAAAAATLAVLREGSAGGEIAGETELAPGLTLRPDPYGRTGGRYASPAGRLLEIETEVDEPGHWLGLHLSLGGGSLAPYGAIGFFCRSNAAAAMVVRPCLRSGLPEGGGLDCFFPRHIVAHAGASDHLDALVIGRAEPLPLEAPWRELILFLPTRDFSWGLQDLRVFAA